MSWLLFLDEPGDQQADLPYGVLTGLAVEDAQVWPLARRLIDAQEQFFGRQVTGADHAAFDAASLLGPEVYRASQRLPELDWQDILRQANPNRGGPGPDPLEAEVALARAKIAYCEYALALAKDYGATAFVILIPRELLALQFNRKLRKDYAYLFERFYYFLTSKGRDEFGIFVKAQHVVGRKYVGVENIEEYFARTTNGRVRAQRIIPTPLYADGTLGILSSLANIVSYGSSWTIRLPGMSQPVRPEMDRLATLCGDMRFHYNTPNGKKDWSFKFIASLDPMRSGGPAGRPDHL